MSGTEPLDAKLYSASDNRQMSMLDLEVDEPGRLEKKALHGLQSAAGFNPVEPLVKPLQIDIRRIHEGQDLIGRTGVQKPIRDKDVLQARTMGEPRGVQDVLRVHKGLRVRVSDSEGAFTPGRLNELRR